MMLKELTQVLDRIPRDAPAASYAVAIVQENLLGKPTRSTRQRTAKRLTELELLNETAIWIAGGGDLAASHIGIGILLKETGELEEALASLKATRAIQQRLADANPTVTDFQLQLANTLLETGDVLRPTGRPRPGRPTRRHSRSSRG
jgi:hypothetical protein